MQMSLEKYIEGDFKKPIKVIIIGNFKEILVEFRENKRVFQRKNVPKKDRICFTCGKSFKGLTNSKYCCVKCRINEMNRRRRKNGRL